MLRLIETAATAVFAAEPLISLFQRKPMAVMLVKRGTSHQQIINEEWILYASVRIVNVKTLRLSMIGSCFRFDAGGYAMLAAAPRGASRTSKLCGLHNLRVARPSLSSRTIKSETRPPFHPLRSPSLAARA